MTKLDFLNRYILQWFFIRLCRSENTERHIKRVRMAEASIVEGFGHSLAYHIEEAQLKVTRYWAIMAWVIPTSGYGNAFRYIGRCRFWRVSKRRITYVPELPPNDWNCRCTL